MEKVTVGESLASAARYIGELLPRLCSSPFAGLVPSVGAERAVVMCDSSTTALGGVIISEDLQRMEWYRVSLSEIKVQFLIKQYIPSFDVGHRAESGHMCFLELMAAVIALLSCRKGRGVLILSDNCAAVSALNKLHSKSQQLDLLMKQLTSLMPDLTTQCMKAVHIEGTSNQVADLISRRDVSTLRELLSHGEDMREVNVDAAIDALSLQSEME